ncbi:MAG: helix-hairpin-helix domain-containing protein [Bacteroidota bacterium]
MQNDWKSAFNFTRVERRGILLLLGLTICFWSLPCMFDLLRPTPDLVDFTDLKLALDSLENQADPAPLQTHRSRKNVSSKSKKPKVRFGFDPNQIGKDSLLLLGFPEFLADRLIKYRQAGGRFRTPSDLNKLYGLRPELYQSLEPYIEITERPSSPAFAKADTTEYSYPIPSGAESGRMRSESQAPESTKKAIPQQVLINQADAEAFRALYGIGPVLSERIVKFREKLGGFYAVEQVKEVYGLPDSTWQVIEEHLVFDPVPLQQLAINQLDEKGLSKHPYINWKTAKVIVKYRDVNGALRGDSSLMAIHGLEQEFVGRVLPYLDFGLE